MRGIHQQAFLRLSLLSYLKCSLKTIITKRVLFYERL